MINAWKHERNEQHATIDWKFSVADARKKFKYEGAELS